MNNEKNIYIKNKNKFRNSILRKSILDIFKMSIFQFPKIEFQKIYEKSDCDHYALIFKIS